MRSEALALVLVLALGPGGAGAQEPARERARTALPTELLRELEGLADGLRQAGAPTEPLFQKALEGSAKRVPSGRLIPVVQAYAGRLEEAHRAFGPFSSGPLVVAGADALQRGVNADALGRLGREEGEGPSPMAVLVLAELVEAGVPTERALAVLQEAMRVRAREETMLGISGEVRRLMRQGQTPQEAAEQVRRALTRGRGGGGVGPPVPPGSEPVTKERRRAARGGGGG